MGGVFSVDFFVVLCKQAPAYPGAVLLVYMRLADIFVDGLRRRWGGVEGK